jgi:3-oxoacyl-(acyl-carrier-protein) synthase
MKASIESKKDFNNDQIGITGVGIGLPGKDRAVFNDTNIEEILQGKNFIDSISEEKQVSIIDKNVSQVKKENGVRSLKFLKDKKESIKLASQMGELDLARDYGLSEGLISVLDSTFQIAIGAGFEALKDAGIPLLQKEGRWSLPEEMKKETGVIFGSAFPCFNNLIEEVTAYTTDKVKRELIKEQEEFIKEVEEFITDPNVREQIKQKMAQKRKKMEEERYEYSRKFLLKTLLMANTQFAEIIGAKGPSTQVNSACASTTQALSIAEDWIKQGRCKRVIILGADNTTSDQTLEWVGTGFLAVGAASTEEKVEEAAIPFDKRREGMILGAGAVALVLETEEAAKERGINLIVELLGTRVANSAFHGTKMEDNHISEEMNGFISHIEEEYGLKREEMASSMLFVSHETYTPAIGGGTAAEIGSIRKAFGEKAREIIITNTKGFTGHPMGANIEDGVAVKALELGMIPPIANLEEEDDDLKDLYLSKGEEKQVDYALRLAAGFGSQIVLALYRRKEGARKEEEKYNTWLKKIGGEKAEIVVIGRVLSFN